MAQYMNSVQIIMQNGNVRYQLRKHYYDDGVPQCQIVREECNVLGGSMTFRYVSEVQLSDFYYDHIAYGFKLFRRPAEVTWYATMENNTPYPEEWTTKGLYLIPIRSRVLEAAQ